MVKLRWGWGCWAVARSSRCWISTAMGLARTSHRMRWGLPERHSSTYYRWMNLVSRPSSSTRRVSRVRNISGNSVMTPRTGSPRLLDSHKDERSSFHGCATAPPIPEGPVRAGKTLTPYWQASAMLLALPRVLVWSFTHPTTGWNPLLQVSRYSGNIVPDGGHTIKQLLTMRQNRAAWGSPRIAALKNGGWLSPYLPSSLSNTKF